MELIKIFADYLNLFNIEIPEQYFRNRILSHPNYPSLLSLTDTLDELGIEYQAMKIDKDKITELDFPTLGHILNEDDSGDFEIFHSVLQLETDTSLYEKWDGIVLTLPANPTITNKECNNYIKKRRKTRVILGLMLILLFCFIFFFIISNSSLNITTFSLLSVLGICISLSLILQSLGKRNVLIKKLCRVYNQDRCEVVKNSLGSKIIGISLEDAGFIYFTVLLLFILLGNLINDIPSFTSALFIASMLSLPITLYSLYYQGLVLKKWCPVCLVIISILWLQFFLIFPYTTNIKTAISNLNYHAISIGLFLFIILIVAWTFVKDLLNENNILKVNSLELLRYKRQPLFFLTLLEKERKINDELWDADMVFGNPDAKIKIIIASNPYCKPCAEVHAHLHDLLNYLSSEFCLIIRFAINASDTNSNKFIAASYLLEVYYTLNDDRKKESISEWFSHMDIETWKIKWGVPTYKDYQELLHKHQEWSTNAKILGTPTVFINGYEYPNFYRVDDIKEIIQALSTN